MSVLVELHDIGDMDIDPSVSLSSCPVFAVIALESDDLHTPAPLLLSNPQLLASEDIFRESEERKCDTSASRRFFERQLEAYQLLGSECSQTIFGFCAIIQPMPGEQIVRQEQANAVLALSQVVFADADTAVALVSTPGILAGMVSMMIIGSSLRHDAEKSSDGFDKFYDDDRINRITGCCDHGGQPGCRRGRLSCATC